MKNKDNYLTIADHNVNMFWQCCICNASADVGPDWYQDNGTPVCMECDQDMDYVKTEICFDGIIK